MHAAAISAFRPKAWADDINLIERDISNHAKLFGRGSVSGIYPKGRLDAR
jgi:hypothetical protein